MIKDYSSLIGIPHEEKDCYAIVADFYKLILNIELKNYYDKIPETKTESQNLISTNIGDFKKVDAPEFGDIIIIKLYGIESHIAIYLGEGRMLHSFKNVGSSIEPVNKYSKMISGYYRVIK